MYTIKDFTGNVRGDLFGGLTAAVVALPLALAFGISSGIGAIAGLYGAIAVGLFAAIFGGTRPQVSGPTGPMTVVVTAMSAHYIDTAPDQALSLVLTTVMLAGLIQIGMGVLRLGKYIITVPYPVISGFMTGIGAIIIILQLAPLMGSTGTGGVLANLLALPTLVTQINPGAALIGIGTLVVVYAWPSRWARYLPSPLLALIISLLAVDFLPAAETIARIGAIPSGLPSLHWPELHAELLKDIISNAIILAILGAIDSLLTSLVADNVTHTQHDSDRELIGQGIGNTVAGLLGGLPGAGATMRTVVNIRAGGSGPLSGAVHSLVLLLIAIGAGQYFENIPLAALAGILIKVGIDIIDWPFLKRLHRLPPFPVGLMLLVLGLTVFVDLITAVFVGVFIKNMVTINKLSDLELGHLIVSDGSREQEGVNPTEHAHLQSRGGQALLMRITGPVSYAVGRGLNKRFSSITSHPLMIIDVSKASIIGISTAMVLEEFIHAALQRGCTIRVIGDQSELEQLGLRELIGTDSYVSSVGDALNTFPTQE